MLKKLMALGLCASVLLTGAGCGKTAEVPERAEEANPLRTVIELNGDTATVDGNKVAEYDYTWHCDPSVAHDEVKDAPAEYYTGEKPDGGEAVYIDHELYYYPQLEESAFRKVNYDGEQEWAYYYTDGQNDDYIFATLPVLGQSVPTDMMHSEEEAAQNKVLHITRAGFYVLKGSWDGQIYVDLGEDAAEDPTQQVMLILDNADITCTVAPGVVFKNVYECGTVDEDATVPESVAGAHIILEDGTDNIITGTNVFRMLKTVYKDEDSTDAVKLQKKMRKTDGALYSYQTMNISGEGDCNGKLTVTSGYEGIDSEMHLIFSGGDITVNSQDDGINVNEDHESIVNFVDGTITINAALGAEGDGVDSNGYIQLQGGTIAVNGVRPPDSALDSEDGITYNAGTILIDGVEQNYEPGSEFRETGRQNGGMGKGDRFGGREFGQDFDIKEFKKQVADLPDDATLEDVMNLLKLHDNRQFVPLDGDAIDKPDMQPADKPDMQPDDAPPQPDAAPAQPQQ